MDTFMGAFAGAFFAFLFVRIGIALDRIYENQKMHHNALSYLERKLNMLLNDISDNQYLIKSSNDILSKNQNGNVYVSYNKLNQLEIDKSVLEKLLNLDLKNDLLGLFVDLDRYNRDAEKSNSFYQEFKGALIDKKIEEDQYILNCNNYIEKLMVVDVYLNNMLIKTKGILVKVRLLLKDNPLFMHLIQKYLTKKKYTDELIKQCPIELEKLNQEIENTRRISKEERKSLQL